jgi:hypothetical protein
LNSLPAEDITVDSQSNDKQSVAPEEVSISGGDEKETEIRAEGRTVVPRGTHTVVSASIAQNFARLLPRSAMVECVAWAWEGNVLRVWTVLSHRDRTLQKQIYRAESLFMDGIGNRPCDFNVVFRESRSLAELVPTKARVLTFTD